MKPTSGSVKINGVYLSHGSVTARTTAGISPTRTPPTAPPELAARGNLSAEMDAAFPRAGNVTLTMIVATTLMNRWRNAVSNKPLLQQALNLEKVIS